jgi:hypothetical protein
VRRDLDAFDRLAVTMRMRVLVRRVRIDMRIVVQRARERELSSDHLGILALVRHIVNDTARVAKLVEELNARPARRVEQRDVPHVRRRAELKHKLAALRLGLRIARVARLIVENQALAQRHAVGARSAWPAAVTPALAYRIHTSLVRRAEHEITTRDGAAVEHRNHDGRVVERDASERDAIGGQIGVESVAALACRQ